MALYGKFAGKVTIERWPNARFFVKIDGEYIPWYTNGVSIETDIGGSHFLNLRIPCESFVHTVDQADDED